jgi:hypothetical protein
LTSITRPSFWQLYYDLPEEVRAQARAVYALFSQSPFHASLQFKKLNGFPVWWSVRIGRYYRAIGARDGDVIRWFWIGSHADYDKLVGC